MSRDPSLAIQAAMIAAMRGASAVSALVGARVYDRAPQEVAFPYVSLGPMFSNPTLETISGEGWEMTAQIDVWSRAPNGRVEAEQIAVAVGDALHDAALAISGAIPVMVRMVGQRVLPDPDMVTTHVAMSVEIVTDWP